MTASADDAFRAEATAFLAALADLTDDDWSRPTRCAPVALIRRATGREPITKDDAGLRKLTFR